LLPSSFLFFQATDIQYIFLLRPEVFLFIFTSGNELLYFLSSRLGTATALFAFILAVIDATRALHAFDFWYISPLSIFSGQPCQPLSYYICFDFKIFFRHQIRDYGIFIYRRHRRRFDIDR